MAGFGPYDRWRHGIGGVTVRQQRSEREPLRVEIAGVSSGKQPRQSSRLLTQQGEFRRLLEETLQRLRCKSMRRTRPRIAGE